MLLRNAALFIEWMRKFRDPVVAHERGNLYRVQLPKTQSMAAYDFPIQTQMYLFGSDISFRQSSRPSSGGGVGERTSRTHTSYPQTFGNASAASNCATFVGSIAEMLLTQWQVHPTTILVALKETVGSASGAAATNAPVTNAPSALTSYAPSCVSLSLPPSASSYDGSSVHSSMGDYPYFDDDEFDNGVVVVAAARGTETGATHDATHATDAAEVTVPIQVPRSGAMHIEMTTRLLRDAKAATVRREMCNSKLSVSAYVREFLQRSSHRLVWKQQRRAISSTAGSKSADATTTLVAVDPEIVGHLPTTLGQWSFRRIICRLKHVVGADDNAEGGGVRIFEGFVSEVRSIPKRSAQSRPISLEVYDMASVSFTVGCLASSAIPELALTGRVQFETHPLVQILFQEIKLRALGPKNMGTTKVQPQSHSTTAGAVDVTQFSLRVAVAKLDSSLHSKVFTITNNALRTPKSLSSESSPNATFMAAIEPARMRLVAETAIYGKEATEFLSNLYKLWHQRHTTTTTSSGGGVVPTPTPTVPVSSQAPSPRSVSRISRQPVVPTRTIPPSPVQQPSQQFNAHFF
jgi:hypothetical protein